MQNTTRKRMSDVSPRGETPKEDAPVSPTTVLSIDVKSLDGRRAYRGKFKYSVPTMGDRVDIATLKAQYLQQLSGVDPGGANVADALAYLSVTLDDKEVPDWWKDSQRGIKLYDFQPLLVLYAEARAYEATFLGGRSVAGADEGEDTGGPADDADGDVGSDVQDPSDGPQVLASFGKGGRGTSVDGLRNRVSEDGGDR